MGVGMGGDERRIGKRRHIVEPGLVQMRQIDQDAQAVIRLPSYEQVKSDPALYAHASRVLHKESNPGNAWPLNVQLAGPLDSVRARLLLSGWENYRTGGWTGLLQTLDKDVTPHELPVLSATHQGRGEVLVMASRPSFDLNGFIPGISTEAFKQLQEEISRTVGGARFNGKPLFDSGAPTTLSFQVGAGTDVTDRIEIDGAVLGGGTAGTATAKPMAVMIKDSPTGPATLSMEAWPDIPILTSAL